MLRITVYTFIFIAMVAIAGAVLAILAYTKDVPNKSAARDGVETQSIGVEGVPGPRGDEGTEFYPDLWFRATQVEQLRGKVGINSGQGVCTSSHDGNVIVVGGSNYDSGKGAVWIFRKSGHIWLEETFISAVDMDGPSNFGSSCAFSMDSTVLAIGAPSNESGKGAVWIYVFQNNRWIHFQKIIAPYTVGFSNQGYSVDLNENGDTLVIGAPMDDGGKGAVWIYKVYNSKYDFVRKLVEIKGGNGNLGHSVAVSNSGLMISASGPKFYSEKGSVFTWRFVEGQNVWLEDGGSIIGDVVGGHFGTSIAIDGTGETLVIGCPNDTCFNVPNQGSVSVYKRKDELWKNWTKLTGLNSVDSNIGYSVSVTNDGDVICAGGPAFNSNVGAFWIFGLYPDGNWRQVSQEFIPSGRSNASKIGGRGQISISGNGETLCVGSVENNCVWVFRK